MQQQHSSLFLDSGVTCVGWIISTQRSVLRAPSTVLLHEGISIAIAQQTHPDEEMTRNCNCRHVHKLHLLPDLLPNHVP